MGEIEWHWYTFEQLTGRELYAIITLRQQVFVVEQQCIYQDCDDLDQRSWHLVGWQGPNREKKPIAYLRVILPDKPGEMVVIGRLLTSLASRGNGTGKILLTLALKRIEAMYPKTAVRISAQHYLLGFYQSFGFHPASAVFDEDFIPHITMIRPPLGKSAKS